MITASFIDAVYAPSIGFQTGMDTFRISKTQLLIIIRFFGIAVLIVFSIFIWRDNVATFNADREVILFQLNDYFETLVLPIHLVQLATQDPKTELPVPVYGVGLNEIADTWGAARSAGRTHEGVDIFAKRGTPVFAVTPGFVVRVGENSIGGNIIFTIGPGGHRYYYAHLERVADVSIGDEVTTDTVVGYVGSSGNAESTPPHLHFGIYTSNGPINPYPYLVDRL